MEARQLKAFQIDLGLSQYVSSDYFAVLGAPVTADALQIRRRYLSIARSLHPDVCGQEPEEKAKAHEYFAKFVNPAYNNLMQARERVEYTALTKLISRRLMKRELKFFPRSEVARNLFRSPSELHYQMSVEAIAKVQYNSLDKISEYTVQLRELNLVYGMYQEGYYPSSFGLQTQENSCQDCQLEDFSNRAFLRSQAYIELAEIYISRNQWMMALRILRMALQIDNTNSKCHALLGLVYLKHKLIGMAKVSFRQAIKINPRESLALKHLVQCALMSSNGGDMERERSSFFGWLGSS